MTIGDLANLTGVQHESDESPRIQSHTWGELEIEGLGKHGDAKLWPGGAKEWDWTETGTHHQPGIQPADVQELLTYKPDVIVLSRGRELRLETTSEALDLLRIHGIDVILEETSVAISKYNDLAVGNKRVAALIHSTC
jgi:hypothetical protein